MSGVLAALGMLTWRVLACERVSVHRRRHRADGWEGGACGRQARWMSEPGERSELLPGHMRSGAIRPRVLPPGSLALGSFTRRFRWDRRLSRGCRLSLIPRLALGWGLSLGFRLNPGR